MHESEHAVSEQAYLRFLTGPQNGRVYVLKDLSVFDLGRGDGCQVTVEDDMVASHHGRIYRKGVTWTFFDLNTEQGSSINDIPVEKRLLAGGEIIRLGTTEMQFTLTPPTGKKNPASEAPPEAAPVALRSEAPSSVSVAPELVVPEKAPAAEVAAQAPPAQVAPAAPVQPMPQPAPAAPPAALVASEPVAEGGQGRYGLVIIDGDSRDVGRRVDLAGKSGVLIGRALDCDFMLSDGKVSRHHTRVEAHPDGHLLLDLNSANGTVVNGQKVSRAILKSGDYIRLGFTVIAYEVVPEPARAV